MYFTNFLKTNVNIIFNKIRTSYLVFLNTEKSQFCSIDTIKRWCIGLKRIANLHFFSILVQYKYDGDELHRHILEF